MLLPSAHSVTSQTILEVERKFCGLIVPQLTSHAGWPPFRSLRYLGEHTFKDVYFDKNDKLSSSGLWIRKRQIECKRPAWEAKVRKGGTFNNSAFEELTDYAAIAKRVTAITGHPQAALGHFGLDVLARIGTRRKSWLANGQFKIVLDVMDFGHEVGEVELERRLRLSQDQVPAVEVETWKRNITQDMDRQIQAFTERYRWAFRSGIPRGKLTAFFEGQQR